MDKEKEISEGNRLIVEFMGGKFVEKYRQDGHDYDMFDLPASFPIKLSDPDIFGMKRTGYLGFHCQWDWLMPVVEKIETLSWPEVNRVWISINGKECGCWTYFDVSDVLRAEGSNGTFKVKNTSKSKIESTWRTVVEFIKWYNKTQKK